MPSFRDLSFYQDNRAQILMFVTSLQVPVKVDLLLREASFLQSFRITFENPPIEDVCPNGWSFKIGEYCVCRLCSCEVITTFTAV